MMKYILSLTFFGFILCSCNLRSSEKISSTKNTNSSSDTLSNKKQPHTPTPWNFTYDTLQKVIKLPFELTKDQWRPYIKYFYKKLEQNSIPSNYPVGIISQNNNYKSILAVIDELPVLMTFDSNKSPVDTLFLFDDYGMNPANEVTEFSTITEDLSITLIDKIFEYELDKNEIQITSTQKFKQTENKYRITNKGIIERLN